MGVAVCRSRLGRSSFGMLDQRVYIGEDAQRTSMTIEDVPRTSGPLDRIAELSARRLAAVFDLDDSSLPKVARGRRLAVCLGRWLSRAVRL